ncbi:MAG TPA: RNA polymerase sigma factor [Chitinophagaceae bacterium]|jgi:RNA polymerase sigma factor (sigma-70 family)|nr:RNA polymerase sigma factor [Chitinophagaceae bacterium]
MTAEDYNDCVKLYADGLYRFMLKSTRQVEDARDLVQSSFEKLWEHRTKVQVVKSKSYLFTIAYHKMIDQNRKNSRMEYRDHLPDHLQAVSGNSPNLKEILEKALNRLNERQRSLVLLKDYEGYSYEEIAEITGLNATQVKVTLHRARLQLKEWLVSVENVL